MARSKLDKKFPYGVCECPTPTGQCCGGCGPVAHSVLRDGKRLKLCTRCTFPGDTDRELLVKKTDKLEPWKTFDVVGFFCILGELSNKK